MRYPEEAEFYDIARGLKEKLRGIVQVANLLNGACFPIVVPQIRFDDYGQAMDEVMIPAVERAYRRQFSGRVFDNHRKGDLAGQVTVVPESRHQVLLDRMQRGYVIGLYFPNPLQGFSVLAQREQMETFPEGLLLAGGFDSAMATMMYSDVLVRDGKTPVYDLSALQWQSSEYSLSFSANDDRLQFGHRAYLGNAFEYFSGGLLFLE